ncbi:MAG: nuclear transport factor 2 family protein [Thiohalomonadales bacterium]
MDNKIREIWDNYALSWKCETAVEKQALFEKCLDVNCEYNSPVIQTKGWDELINHMLDFHKNIPGGYFTTNYFLDYNSKSIAKWDMLNNENTVIGNGVSYCEYNDNGKLKTMTGFFDVA